MSSEKVSLPWKKLDYLFCRAQKTQMVLQTDEVFVTFFPLALEDFFLGIDYVLEQTATSKFFFFLM